MNAADRLRKLAADQERLTADRDKIQKESEARFLLLKELECAWHGLETGLQDPNDIQHYRPDREAMAPVLARLAAALKAGGWQTLLGPMIELAEHRLREYRKDPASLRGDRWVVSHTEKEIQGVIEVLTVVEEEARKPGSAKRLTRRLTFDHFPGNYAHECQKLLRKAESGAAAAIDAHKSELFPKGELSDPELTLVIERLAARRGEGRPAIEIIREVTKESKGNCPRALGLQKRVRTARSRGETTLPPSR